MNRDGGAPLPTTYDRILVTCLSSTSRYHILDEVRVNERKIAITYKFRVSLCNMNVPFLYGRYIPRKNFELILTVKWKLDIP